MSRCIAKVPIRLALALGVLTMLVGTHPAPARAACGTVTAKYDYKDQYNDYWMLANYPTDNGIQYVGWFENMSNQQIYQADAGSPWTSTDGYPYHGYAKLAVTSGVRWQSWFTAPSSGCGYISNTVGFTTY